MPRKRQREPDEDLDDDVAEAPVRRRRPRRRWKLFFGLSLLVVAAILAPTIIANTPLRNALLGSAIAPAAGRLASSAAVLSWTSGQALTGVTLHDAAGKPIATIDSATIDRSLVALAANNRHLGKIVVTRPVVHVETRAGGSNIEDLLARLAEAAAAKPPSTSGDASTPTLAEIEIVEGTILGRDEATGQAWRIDGLNAAARPAASGAWEATGSGVLALADSASLQPPNSGQQKNSSGRFKFQLHGKENGATQLDLIADRLPLAPLEPWLARVVPGARLLGTTSTDLKLAYKAGDGIAGPGATNVVAMSPSPTAKTGDAIAGFMGVVSAAGKVDVADVRFTADALAGDLVELRTGSLAVDVDLAGTQLSAKQLKLTSDWCEGEATGAIDLTELAALSANRLPATDASLTARVDLREIARMLPRTLRLRPEVRIDSGRLQVSARSEREDATRHWAVAAAVEDLVGHDGTRAIRWNDAVEAAVDLGEEPAGPQLRRAILRSPFASLLADGADGGLEGELQFDLEQLAAQLGQFVDLSAWQLRGSGSGKFSWRDTGPDKFAASANVDFRAIDVRRDGKIVWVDPELHVELQSSGLRLAARPIRVETATALMRGPRDSLEFELLEPVDLGVLGRDWFMRIKGDGPLDSWAGRLRPWVAAVPDELAGQSTVSARLRLSGDLVEVTQSQLSITDLRTRLGSTPLVEPRVEAGGDFRWDRMLRSIESQDLQLTSSTVAARARGVDIRLADAGPPTVRGDIAFRGDLERVAAWLGMVGTSGGLWPRGQGVGRVQLASDANSATANLTLTSEPFTLVRGETPFGAALSDQQGSAAGLAPATVAWHEPNLRFATQLAYTHADDSLQLTNLQLDGRTVQLTGNGRVGHFRTARQLEGAATLTYDSAELAKLLSAYLGPGVRLQGAEPLRLTANGALNNNLPAPSPLRGGLGRGETAGTSAIPISLQPPGSSLQPAAHWSQRLNLSAQSGWTAANLYGLPIGQANLTAAIRDGQIQFQPLDLAVGQGRLTAQPRVVLDATPQAFQLASGPLASNVAVSAEVSEAMLKYAAPILASATRISGTFSLTTDGVTVPLDDPKKATTKGRLTMHQLAILPGPGLQDVVMLIQRLEQLARSRQNLLDVLAQPPKPVTGITMTDQAIDVQVVDGRVYHRDLKFLVDDVPVTSYGSVGFDQTIALVIRVPVQAKWVGKEPALQGLIGQVIEIPVSGTFTRWRVDERAVGQFLAQAAQSAVGGAIGNEINKALDGLFRPK
jgi:translocation and assembly module TamB